MFYKKLKSFGALIRNIFTPLFEVTIDPASHPDLHLMLAHVGYIDCVDDESVIDDLTLREGPISPDEYAYDPAFPERFNRNPPYRHYHPGQCFWSEHLEMLRDLPYNDDIF